MKNSCPANDLKDSDHKESFYSIFKYIHLEMDACDRTICFYDAIITRDIPSLGLKLGDCFQQVNWHIGELQFMFVANWELNTEDNTYYPNKASIAVKQIDLGPYLVWWDKDLPSAIL